jgi:hypothetical protein
MLGSAGKEGRHLVRVKPTMRNQTDTVMCTGTAETQLPRRS